MAAWLYAIQAAAYYQLNGSDTVRAAAEKGIRLSRGRHASAEPDLRLALLNSMNTPEDMQRSLAQFDAEERTSGSPSARICIMIQRGMARADLMQVQGALIDLTSAYVQGQALPDSMAPLRAFSATALASVLSRRGLLELSSPMFEEALADYKKQGFFYDILTTHVRQGLAKAFDGQAAEAVREFNTLLSNPHINMISDDIVAIVRAHLCQSYASLKAFDQADRACFVAERLIGSKPAPSWYTVYSSRADLAMLRGQPREALAYLRKAERWRIDAPQPHELDLRARAYAALGQPEKAVSFLTQYVDVVRKQDRDDHTYLADAWRARVFALEKEAERARLTQSLELSRERSNAQRKRIAIVIFASTVIITLLLAIVFISQRARSRTIRLTAEIQQRASEKIQMLAHISHEIRSPLGSMTLIARSLSGSDEISDDAKRVLSRMDRNGERISRLLTDMLDYSRIEAGQLSLRPSSIELSTFFDELLEPYRLESTQKGIDLELSIADDVPTTIMCDRQRLGQVLDNLVANAVRFTDAGRVTLRVAKASGVEAVLLSVEDTGIGIPPDQLKRLFVEFRQVDTEEHNRGGTGLGLVISRTLMEAMGGSLCLSERPGGGLIASVIAPTGLVSANV